MHKLLLKLAQPFVALDFISVSQANSALQKIINLPFWPQDYFKDQGPLNTLVTPVENISLAEHLLNIQELRIKLEQFEKIPQIVENHINYLLSYLMPTNAMIQTWDKTTQYVRLLLLSRYAYYIKTDQNARNLIYPAISKYGELTISINLAKPEKTQAQISAEKTAVQTNLNEPHCGICIENLNFHGSICKPSRENLRVIYENLNQHNWFFQYSPYAYLDGHFVINDLVHTPMLINDETIVKLFSFVDVHPEFMLGSNADLTIVGGSLLGHNHFQGALSRLPITYAKSRLTCQSHNCQLELLHWPLNTIKVSSQTLSDCVQMVNWLTHFWRSYQQPGLINQQNNTVTLITEKADGRYFCYVILRNNAVSETYPQGIYHVHADKFHIKQENIGLMEAGGLAILPGRLISEFKDIIQLSQTQPIKFLSLLKASNKLSKHALWIEQLQHKHKQLTLDILLADTATVFIAGLEDCQIFKPEAFKMWFKDFLVHHPVQLDNQCGLKLEILNVGNIIKQISLFDQPLLLEYADASQYCHNEILLNAFVGPACGRIEQGKIITSNKTWQLPVDQQQNYIHGMEHKWSDLIYDITVIDQAHHYAITFQAQQFNPDLKANYQITNTLLVSKLDNTLVFTYQVDSDLLTLCNPSHHFYWTLNHASLKAQTLTFAPSIIWKLNNHQNPQTPLAIKTTETNSVQTWMELFEQLTSQNKEVIDHPFVLNTNALIYSNQHIMMTMTPQINELVVYTYFSQTPKLFKGHCCAICFESQYVPTSSQHMNSDQVITDHYVNQVKYQFQFKKHN